MIMISVYVTLAKLDYGRDEQLEIYSRLHYTQCGI